MQQWEQGSAVRKPSYEEQHNPYLPVDMPPQQSDGTENDHGGYEHSFFLMHSHANHLFRHIIPSRRTSVNRNFTFSEISGIIKEK